MKATSSPAPASSGAGRAARTTFVAAAALLVTLFVALQIVRSVEPLSIDSGLFACFGRWIPAGRVPYRDIWDSKPPLVFYTYVLARALPGGTVRQIWLLESLWLAATLALQFLLARRLWGRWAGLLAAALLLLALWCPWWNAMGRGYRLRMQSEELLALPMIGAAWLALAARARTRAAFACGVAMGIAGLYKIPSLAVAVAWMGLWFLVLPARAAVRRALAFAGGLLVPWAVAALLLLHAGAFGDFVQAAFVYSAGYAAEIAARVGGWGRTLEDFATRVAIAVPELLLGAGVGLAVGPRKPDDTPDRPDRPDHDIRWWLALFLAMSFASVLAQRQLVDYHYLVVAPALSLAATAGVLSLVRSTRARGPLARFAAGVGLAAMAALAARQALRWQRAYGRDAEVILGRTSREALLFGYGGGAASPALFENAARFVRAHSGPSDGLLVWGTAPGIYALADRHPVTRFPFHKVLLTGAPLSLRWPGLAARRADFLDRLRRDPPAWIVVATHDSNGFEDEDSYAEMLQFPAFRDLVEREYVQTELLGNLILYRRR